MSNMLKKTASISVYMNDEEKIRLTREWICTMLYTGTKSMSFFVDEGCKVMIYGWNYEDIERILGEMVQDGTIEFNGGLYALPLKGRFIVKKSTIVPLLNLTENQEYVQAFLSKNRENCDQQFIETLAAPRDSKGKESIILSYAKENYDKLATMVGLAVQFMSSLH